MCPQGNSLQVLGFAGSLRRGSYNRALLRAAIELAPTGLDIQTFDRLGELPLFNQDIEEQGDPKIVTDFKEAIRGADALLIVTPEYNYGTPGVLKNAIDWASRPPGASVLNEKPVALMGASMGMGGTARSQLALRQAFVFTKTYVLTQPEVFVGKAQEKFDSQGNLIDEATRRFVKELLGALADWTQQFQARIKKAA